MEIRDAISNILAGNNLTVDESASVMAQIMNGTATSAQISAYLVALRCKGETVDELVGSVRCMREHAVPVDLAGSDAVDLCGTGGDGKSTFNISTTCAFVVAGTGVKVAKHGNRAASSKCGSADLLEHLGVAITLGPAQVAECINEVGIGFMFAPLYHPAMKNVVPVRKELGIRTIFNVLGPLSNPAGVSRQLVGVFDRNLVKDIANTLRDLGAKSALVVHGNPGYDEATTVDSVEFAHLRSGEVTVLGFEPESMGFPKAQPDALCAETPEENARITLAVLDGESGPCADTVILNSSLALMAAGKTARIEDGIALSRESIESGNARKVLDTLIEISQKLAENS